MYTLGKIQKRIATQDTKFLFSTKLKAYEVTQGPEEDL